jgi:hypothetical protein
MNLIQPVDQRFDLTALYVAVAHKKGFEFPNRPFDPPDRMQFRFWYKTTRYSRVDGGRFHVTIESAKKHHQHHQRFIYSRASY